MKILLAHNFYGSAAPSGENSAFQAESELLAQHGHEVSTFIRHSDELRRQGAIGAARGALATAWNPFSAHRIRTLVQQLRPDVVHVHNTFPLLSPSILYGVGKGAARVLTLHNYRLFCANAIPMRGSSVCTECLDQRSVRPALWHGCYRGSRLATLPLAFGILLHRALRTWHKQLDAIIVLTEFQRSRMVAAGLPEGRVFVKPNFYSGNPALIDWKNRNDQVVFAGRLSPEKGVECLVRAWIQWGSDAPALKVFGDGPMRAQMESLLRASPAANVTLLGQQPSDVVERQIAQSRLVIVPSQCFEGFPMVIREAFAYGTPVAASNLGPLPSIVLSGENGVLFDPNPDSLLKNVRDAWERPYLLETLGSGAQRSYRRQYTAAANHATLMSIYESAVAYRREREGAM